MIDENNNQPITPTTQLAYVLPKKSLHLLSKKHQKKLLKSYENKYPEYANITWAYCKYFWESHVDLPHINIEQLTKVLT